MHKIKKIGNKFQQERLSLASDPTNLAATNNGEKDQKAYFKSF